MKNPYLSRHSPSINRFMVSPARGGKIHRFFGLVKPSAFMKALFVTGLMLFVAASFMPASLKAQQTENETLKKARELSEEAGRLVSKAQKSKVQGKQDLALSQYEKSLYLSKTALETGRKGLGENHPELALFLDNVADVYIARHDLLQESGTAGDEEEVCDFVLQYEQAEWIRTRAHGTPFHTKIAKTLQRAGDLWCICHPPRAGMFYQSAVKVQKQVNGAQHPAVADSLDRLGNYLRIHMADFQAAKKAYEEARQIRRSLFGEKDPRITKNSAALAWISFYIGHGDYARGIMKKSIQIREQGLGCDHAQVADSLLQLARLMDMMAENSDNDTLFSLLERARIIREKAFGRAHPKVAEIYLDAAMIYRNQNQPKKALPLYEKAHAIFREQYGPEHPDVMLIEDEIRGLK